MSDVAVVIVGGGSSRRYGEENKLFVRLKGVPLFIYSLRNFAPCAAPGNLIFVAPAAERENFERLAAEYLPETAVTWINGGTTRSGSVRNGLAAVTLKSGFVAIHDAARPLADAGLLEMLVDTAEKTGGAIPGKPVTDTIKRCLKDGTICETVDREPLWRVETPQVFALEKLREAYRVLPNDNVTDDAGVMEYAGFPVTVCSNPKPNLKLTYREEFKLLEELM